MQRQLAAALGMEDATLTHHLAACSTACGATLCRQAGVDRRGCGPGEVSVTASLLVRLSVPLTAFIGRPPRPEKVVVGNGQPTHS